MEFFYASKDILIDIPQQDGTTWKISMQGTESPDLDTIYVSTGACLATFRMIKDIGLAVNRLATKKNRDEIFSLPNFPYVITDSLYSKHLDEYQYSHEKHIPSNTFKPYKPKKDEKILVINGMGTGLGDGINGLQALRIFYEETGIKPTLGIVPVVADRAHMQLYASNEFDMIILPLTLRQLLNYDSVVDFSALSIKDEFNTLNMCDFYLKNLGIDPTTIDAKRKKNQLKLQAELAPQFKQSIDEIKSKKKKIIGLKLASSTQIRSLSRDKSMQCIKDILTANNKNHVFLFDDNIQFPNADFLTNKDKKRFHVISKIDYMQLAHIISHLDALVTVDTCFYHIAEAFDIPTLVLFTTIDPKLRITYYENCKGIDLVNPVFKGKHMSLEEKDYVIHYKYLENFRLKKHLRQIKL